MAAVTLVHLHSCPQGLCTPSQKGAWAPPHLTLIFRLSLGRQRWQGVSRWINTDVEMPDFCSQPSTPAHGSDTHLSMLVFAAGTMWGGGF